MGMKSSLRRNFEAGILSDDPSLVESAMEHFDSVWRGEHCPRCSRRQYCSDPIQ
jgi:phosphatidylserine/phosphatidylglycerophosphate/cardiolipin synthase-like enzyme